MPEKCTCGTTLVEEARFCHRCGRPTSQAPANLEPETLPTVAASAIPVQGTAAQLPVGFGNPIAVRVAAVTAIMASMLISLPGLILLFLVWWLLAGWVAVTLYRRLTGLVISVQSGARLGSMTGIFVFIGFTLLTAIMWLANGKQYVDEAVREKPELLKAVSDPAMMAMGFFVMLVFVFIVAVGACAAGGAFAARSMARRTGTNI